VEKVLSNVDVESIKSAISTVKDFKYLNYTNARDKLGGYETSVQREPVKNRNKIIRINRGALRQQLQASGKDPNDTVICFCENKHVSRIIEQNQDLLKWDMT
jgi:hypothetical protein